MNDLQILTSKRVHEGKVFNLIVDEIQYPSGNKGIREVAEHPGGAVAVALFSDRSILLIRQFRYPTREFLYELPAGKLDPGEDPRACAERELREETGYVGAGWEKLTVIYTSPGFCTEKLHIFLTRDPERRDHERTLEEGEQGMTVSRVPLDEAVGMIRRGEIVDAKTICGVLLTHLDHSRENAEG